MIFWHQSIGLVHRPFLGEYEPIKIEELTHAIIRYCL